MISRLVEYQLGRIINELKYVSETIDGVITLSEPGMPDEELRIACEAEQRLSESIKGLTLILECNNH